MKLHSSNLNPKSDVDRKVTISSLSKKRDFSVDLHSTKLLATSLSDFTYNSFE